MKYDKAELAEIDDVLQPPQSLLDKLFSLVITSASRKSTLTLRKGIALLNMCIQRSGAGDGPTSVVLDFLKPLKN